MATRRSSLARVGILPLRITMLICYTACMNDQSDLPPELHDLPTEQLKHGTGKYSHIILVPQPTDDPNDPLNWPLWKKDMILCIVGFSAAVVGAYGPMLGPGFIPIAKELNISISTLAHSTAWLILTIGLSVFITNPLAKIVGKRPVYVLAIIFLTIVNIWGAAAKSYSSFLGSRIVGGFAMAPYEILVQATIGDLYFVHQRATRIAVWNMFLLSGIAGASFISGYIIEDLGYKWTFGMCAILFGVWIFAVFFFVPETAYRRKRIVPRAKTPAQTSNSTSPNQPSTPEKTTFETTETSKEEISSAEPIPAKKTYIQTLAIFSGIYTTQPLKVFIRPFIMFTYPAVIWAWLLYGTVITWIVVFSVVNGVIFPTAYQFSVSETGLTGLSPFIFGVIGEAISGPLNDWICVKLTERNKGIYEPEFRLPLMIVVVILGTVGFYGFGATVDAHTHWTGPVITYGLANMSLCFLATCVFGYLLDSYPTLSEEAFVAINSRNLLTFGLTYFVNDWLVKDGPLKVFNILGSAFLGVSALTIPLWVFGKRIRGWLSERQFLNDFMNDLE
ncbi:major facilitator superfamily domain-containing protein [Clohesyomyces aquaticus]|uniref:Major facilitator superfamily domain-containing protein n=1 Tax=Clohesyomyces aquaticus TaxID=1231657 RepID=A0A1Y2A6F6_9PLEO|nr:major facilitator superfamily domain-containing protein [Clohesyomyces aquaticus]